MRGHRGAEAYALCFLGQLRGMLGQREAAREMILKGVADRRVLGDLPGAAMSRGEGLGYFVEMIRGDWQTGRARAAASVRRALVDGRQELPRDHRGWLAHCLYALGRYDDADECASITERAAAKSWVAAQVVWRGGACNAARAPGARRAGGGACEGGGRSRSSDRPGRHADGRPHESRGGAASRGAPRRKPCPWSRTHCGATTRRKSFRAAARARSLIEELAPRVAAAVSVATPRSQ